MTLKNTRRSLTVKYIDVLFKGSLQDVFPKTNAQKLLMVLLISNVIHLTSYSILLKCIKIRM
jgi:hypothetical protein